MSFPKLISVVKLEEEARKNYYTPKLTHLIDFVSKLKKGKAMLWVVVEDQRGYMREMSFLKRARKSGLIPKNVHARTIRRQGKRAIYLYVD